MSNKKLMSLQLATGATILCEAIEYVNHFIVINPIRPTMLSDGTIAYVAMNPFSDSTEYPIPKNLVQSYGSMHFKYIDIYYMAVERIEQAIKNDYFKLTEEPVSDSIQVGVEFTGGLQ